MSALRFSLLFAASLIFAGCDEKSSEGLESPESTEQTEPLTEPEKKALQAARPFLNAIAAGDYAAAYGQFSSHARARMSLNQFLPPADEAASAANEARGVTNPSVQDFQKFMALAANEYGSPAKVLSADQIETDPKVLAGKGDAMETAFTIGLMPESIPAAIRKASIRAQIGVSLTPGRLKEIADQEGMSVEELQKDEDFSPYFNLKVVLVEESSGLKVGYFEITPLSMWD